MIRELMTVTLAGMMVLGPSPLFSDETDREGGEARTMPSDAGEMIRVTRLFVEQSRDRLVLVARGTTAGGDRIERREMLPETFRIEKEPYESTPEHVPGAGCEMSYRILLNHQGQDFVAGVVVRTGMCDSFEGLHYVDTRLTNVLWGFDPSTQKFWYDADPRTLPPRPVKFEGRSWKGLLFGLPSKLQRFTKREVKAIVKLRGARVVTWDRKVDVVLLRDDVDFTWTREKMAEEWMRLGAKVLWERDFPRPTATD